MRKQAGFTLVELIVVIVILGILAATALPRFVSVSSDARFAALNGLAGGLRSSVALVQAKYYSSGTNTSPVQMADGVTTVVVGTSGAASGIPTAAGILNAIQDYTGFFPDSTNATATALVFYSGSTATAFPNCKLTYNPSTGQVTVNAANSSSC